MNDSYNFLRCAYLTSLFFVLTHATAQVPPEEGYGHIAYDTAHDWSQQYQQWMDLYSADAPISSGPAGFTFDTATINSLFREELVTGVRVYFGMEEVEEKYNLKLMIVGVVGSITDTTFGRDSLELGVYTFSEDLSWSQGYIANLLENNPYQFSQSNYQRVYLDTVEGSLRPPGRPATNENGAESGTFILAGGRAEMWAADFDTTFREALLSYPLGEDTLSSPCSYLFKKGNMVNALDYNEDKEQFDNPIRFHIGINGVYEFELYITLADPVGNGDIFNKNPAADYSKILDFGRRCPPHCGKSLLNQCSY